MDLANGDHVLHVIYDDWPSGDEKDMTVKVYASSDNV